VKKSDLQIGQTVYLKPQGNRARGGNKEITTDRISSIGKQYFYLEKEKNKVSIETGLENSQYTADFRVYLSKQEIQDEYEANRLVYEIRDRIGQYGETKIPLYKLKKIIEILNSLGNQ
jgi:hypothetical protein